MRVKSLQCAISRAPGASSAVSPLQLPSSSSHWGETAASKANGGGTRVLPEAGLFSPFSILAVCGLMVINCCANPSVWVITPGYSSERFFFFRQDSNWSLKLRLHHSRSPSVSVPNPRPHLSMLESSKCTVGGVTGKQQTCDTVCARACVCTVSKAPDRLREALSPGYCMRRWRWCWQLWEARQQLRKHKALTSLSTSLLCMFGERHMKCVCVTCIYL